MKREFLPVETRKQAEKIAPWADKIVKVDGGYRAFETANDYKIWKGQK